MSETEAKACLIISEGERIEKVWIEETANSGWVMCWNLLKLDGSVAYQRFWGNATMKNLDLSYIKGQFVRSIAILESSIRITFSNETSIEFPPLFD